jgi:glycosyltransferase 2 family protein
MTAADVEGERVALEARRARWITLARTLGFAGALGIVAFVAVEAVREASLDDLDWPLLIPAVLASMVWWVLLARGWALLMSGRWTFGDASTWCRTQALRYLPGGFWAPASRLAVAEGGLADRVRTVAAENVGALVAGLAIGGLCLAAAGRLAWAPLALVVLLPTILVRARLLPPGSPATVPTYVAAFAGYAVAAVLAQAAVSGFEDSLLVAGAAGIAWAVGLVVVIAPSGLGVREVVYVGLLAGALGSGEPAAGAVVLRLVTIAAELLVLLASARALGRRNRTSG